MGMRLIVTRVSLVEVRNGLVRSRMSLIVGEREETWCIGSSDGSRFGRRM